MYSETMILVRDVEASAAWYHQLLDAHTDHGGDEFERIVDGDRVLLLLHRMDAEEHPAVVEPTAGRPGSGVLIYFHVDDVAAVHRRALEMGADVVDEPHVNPKARQLEFSLRDPDGYAVTVCRESQT